MESGPHGDNGALRELVTEQPPQVLRVRRNEGPRELRLVLVGKSGGGRSATGNSIVGTAAFESRLATAAVTQRSSMQSGFLRGYDVHVVDTPDAFDSPERSARCCREVARCALLSAPGPHALLLVTQLGRFTQEDEAAVQQVWRLFGSGAAGRTVVVFTRGDELRGGSLLRYVQDTGTYALRKLLRDCGQRCCAFDNRATGKQKEEQVGELLAIVLEMLGGDLNNYYRNGLYYRAEQLMERPDIDFEKKCDLLAEDVEKQLQGGWHTSFLQWLQSTLVVQRLQSTPVVQWLLSMPCSRCIFSCFSCILAVLLSRRLLWCWQHTYRMLSRCWQQLCGVFSWCWQQGRSLYNRFVH